MPAIPINQFFGWNGGVAYSRWDVAFGATVGDTRYFYSTIDSNFGNYPNAQFVFSPISSSRQDNVTRVLFNQTGAIYFQQGSVVVVSGVAPDSSVNYTGLALAGGQGFVDILNPGLNTSNAITAGGVTAPIHPYWSTGMMWIPGYVSQVTQNTQVINTQLGEGYSQRMNPVINSNSLSWDLTFSERTDKETMGLLNFLQVAGGATPFVMPFPVGNLYNNPYVKYIASAPKHQITSLGLNTTTFTATQVFDIG